MTKHTLSTEQFSANLSIVANDPASLEAQALPWTPDAVFGAIDLAETVVMLGGRLEAIGNLGAPVACTPASDVATVAGKPATVSAAGPAASSSSSSNLGTNSNGLADILYPLNSDGSVDITVADINQGTALGDCYFLSSLGEIAIQHAVGIQDMIYANANGTETVSLYEDASGKAVGWSTTSFKTVQFTVNNANFISGAVNGQSGQAVWNNEQVIWPQVLENAFAQANGGYSDIANGGSPVLAMEALTGHAASYYAAGNVSASTLSSDWSAGDLMVFDTPEYNNSTDTNSAYALYGEHAYMFDGLTTTNGVTYVKLLNPWGYDNPDLIPVSSMSSVINEIDIGTWKAPTTAPSISGNVASAATTDEATVSPFSGVVVSAVAGATETATVKLSAAANGTLSDANGGSYSASTGTYTVTGTAAAVTSALDALVFTPTAHQVAPGSKETTTLTLATKDANGTATASTIVTATATTDPMNLAGVATTGSTNDLTAIKPFSSVTVSEPDAGQTFTATVTLSAAANGKLTDVDGGSYNASTGVWTYTGSSVATLDTVLDALTFTPTAHQVAPGTTVATTLALKISDTAGSAATASDKITTTATNQAMAVTGTSTAAIKITDEATASPFKSVSISDPDYGRTVSATVDLSNAAYGKLSSVDGGSYNATLGIWTVSGTAAAVTAALDTLVFTPTAHEFNPGTVTAVGLSLGVSDNVGTSSSSSATVDVTAATDPIQLTGLAGTTTADTTAIKPLSGVTITEPDHGQTITATVTPSATANGTFSNLGTGSVSSAGVYTVSGTAAAVTSAIDALTFAPVAHQGVSGSTVATTFAVKLSDTAGATTSGSATLTVKESTLTIASGSTDTVSTTQTIAEMQNNGTVLIKSGSLDVSKVVDAASTGTFELDGKATLDIASIQGSSATMSFIGGTTGNLLDIDASGSFGSKSGTASYTGPTLSGFGAGDEIDLRNVASSGATLSYNSSTGLLQVMHGTTDLATLHFSNATLGAGSFHAATDGASGLFITHS